MLNKRVIVINDHYLIRDLSSVKLNGRRKIVTNKLFRSSKPTAIDTESIRKLKSLNIKQIIDLRDVTEAQNEISSSEIRKVHIPIFQGSQCTIVPRNISESIGQHYINIANTLGKGGAKRKLFSINESLVSDEYCINQLKAFFRVIIDNDDAILWHCTSGKDRTGLTAALLLYSLDADFKSIMEDYIYSNKLAELTYADVIENMSEAQAQCWQIEEILKLKSVSSEYLLAAFRKIENDYGSIDNFLNTKLELTETDLSILRDKYTQQEG